MSRELYFTKTDLPAVPKGVVERFMLGRGEEFVALGYLERYDPDDPVHRAAAERAGYAHGPRLDKQANSRK
jgi:hypothetical protein